MEGVNKGPFSLLGRIISVECPTNSDLRFMLIGCLELPLFDWMSAAGNSNLCGILQKLFDKVKLKGL